MPFEISIDSQKFLEIESRLRSDAKEILASSALKEDVGDFAVERIKYQARIGEPYNSDGAFPALADSTVKNRRYLERYNKTHEVYEAEFANVTLTGEFLDSLTWVDEGDTRLLLRFDGDHAPYNSANGPMSRKEDLSNSTLAEYLAAKGFVVFDRSLQTNDTFVKRIKSLALAYIRRGLKVRSKLGGY